MTIRYLGTKLAILLIGIAALATPSAPATAANLATDHVVLKSALSVDPVRNTVVLPLYKGIARGETVYYILADSSNESQANSLGLNYAPSIGQTYTQRGSGTPTALTFSGVPDFTPDRVYTPSKTGFPPAEAKPGTVADDDYSPFVKLADGTTLDAPIVAKGAGPFDITTHKNTADRVLAIDSARHTVTILLARGFFNGSQVLYLSTDASDPGVASIERATYTKKLANSSPSSEQPIVALANGQTGVNNPQAQGLAHLALDEHLSQDAVASNTAALGSPLNVLATFSAGSSAAAYTPLWAANVGVWSQSAVAAGQNKRVTSVGQAYALAGRGEITSPDGKQFGPAGFVVNCPVVAFIDPLK
jgi:hypothetical protein